MALEMYGAIVPSIHDIDTLEVVTLYPVAEESGLSFPGYVISYYEPGAGGLWGARRSMYHEGEHWEGVSESSVFLDGERVFVVDRTKKGVQDKCTTIARFTWELHKCGFSWEKFRDLTAKAAARENELSQCISGHEATIRDLTVKLAASEARRAEIERARVSDSDAELNRAQQAKLRDEIAKKDAIIAANINRLNAIYSVVTRGDADIPEGDYDE